MLSWYKSARFHSHAVDLYQFMPVEDLAITSFDPLLSKTVKEVNGTFATIGDAGLGLLSA